MNYERLVLRRVPKVKDIEIHVSRLTTDYGVYMDVREYVVSLDQYGRGISFPEELASEILGSYVLGEDEVDG